MDPVTPSLTPLAVREAAAVERLPALLADLKRLRWKFWRRRERCRLVAEIEEHLRFLSQYVEHAPRSLNDYAGCVRTMAVVDDFLICNTWAWR